MNSRKIFTKLALLAGFLAFTPFAHSAVGDLDPTFGANITEGITSLAASGGKITFTSAGYYVQANALAYQTPAGSRSYGRIIAAGYSAASPGTNKNFFVAALRADNGHLDTSFGDTNPASCGTGRCGFRTIPFNGNDLDDEANALAIRGNGEIYLGGYATETISGVTRQTFAVARLSADGDLLTAFDTDGKMIANFDDLHRAPTDSSINAMAFQSDNQLVLVGKSAQNPSGTTRMTVVRINPDTGVVDTAFANTCLSAPPTLSIDSCIVNAGKVILIGSMTGASAELNALSIYNNKIYVAGAEQGPGAKMWVLRRLSAEGNLETSFVNTVGAVGFDGVSTIRSVTAMSISGDKLVVGGNSQGVSGPSKFVLAKVDSNTGNLDATFGDFVSGSSGPRTGWTSFAAFPAGGPSSNVAFSLAVQSDGRIVQSGSVSYPTPTSHSQFEIVRYNPDGVRDTSFQTVGYVQTPFEGQDVAPFASVLTNDGKLILAGSSSPAHAMVLAAYSGFPVASSTRCGDGICSPGETSTTCSADCRAPGGPAGGGSAPTGDSGSSCSFNPQAVFSFSQLALLAIFPAFVGLRLRRRK